MSIGWDKNDLVYGFGNGIRRKGNYMKNLRNEDGVTPLGLMIRACEEFALLLGIHYKK